MASDVAPERIRGHVDERERAAAGVGSPCRIAIIDGVGVVAVGGIDGSLGAYGHAGGRDERSGSKHLDALRRISARRDGRAGERHAAATVGVHPGRFQPGRLDRPAGQRRRAARGSRDAVGGGAAGRDAGIGERENAAGGQGSIGAVVSAVSVIPGRRVDAALSRDGDAGRRQRRARAVHAEACRTRPRRGDRRAGQLDDAAIVRDDAGAARTRRGDRRGGAASVEADRRPAAVVRFNSVGEGTHRRDRARRESSSYRPRR